MGEGKRERERQSRAGQEVKYDPASIAAIRIEPSWLSNACGRGDIGGGGHGGWGNGPELILWLDG